MRKRDMTLIAAILTFLGVVVSSGLIQFVFNRTDKKHDDLADIKKDIQKLTDASIKSEKDQCRTQLLLLMHCYPAETHEIITLAEHYFSVLSGDWYATGIFNRWLEKSGIAKPEWFDERR